MKFAISTPKYWATAVDDTKDFILGPCIFHPHLSRDSTHQLTANNITNISRRSTINVKWSEHIIFAPASIRSPNATIRLSSSFLFCILLIAWLSCLRSKMLLFSRILFEIGVWCRWKHYSILAFVASFAFRLSLPPTLNPSLITFSFTPESNSAQPLGLDFHKTSVTASNFTKVAFNQTEAPLPFCQFHIDFTQNIALVSHHAWALHNFDEVHKIGRFLVDFSKSRYRSFYVTVLALLLFIRSR